MIKASTVLSLPLPSDRLVDLLLQPQPLTITSLSDHVTPYVFSLPPLVPSLLPFIPTLITHILLVRLLRCRRLQCSTCHQRHQLQMDVITAFKIHNYFVELEFPSTSSAAPTFRSFQSLRYPLNIFPPCVCEPAR